MQQPDDVLKKIIWQFVGKQCAPATVEEISGLYADAFCKGDIAFIVPLRPKTAFGPPHFSRQLDDTEISGLLQAEIGDDYGRPTDDPVAVQDYFELNYTQAACLYDRQTNLVVMIFDHQESGNYSIQVMQNGTFCLRYAAYVRNNLDRVAALTENAHAPVDATALHLATEKQKHILLTISTIERLTGIPIPHPLRQGQDAGSDLARAAVHHFGRQDTEGRDIAGEDLSRKIAEACRKSGFDLN